MKTIKFILGILITFSIVQINSQSVTVDLISLNNQSSITNCSTVDFGTNQNNTLNIMFTITNNSGGSGYAKVMLKYNSLDSGYQVGNLIDVPSSTWSSTTQRSFTFFNVSIQASQVQISGSSLFVQYVRDANQSVLYKSCEFPIIKTQLPTFNISPTSQSVACGSTRNYTFTVNNVYNTPNVTYNWSYSGWTLVSSTANSKTLTPASATILPSHVVVTPYVNGVAQTSKTCTVTRASFTSNAIINGNSSICPSNLTSTYTISNVESGNNVVWSLSNNNIATILTSNSTSATIMGIQNGSVSLVATITNACNQTTVKTFNINILASSNFGSLSNYSNSGYLYYCSNQQNPCGWQEKDIAITLSNAKPNNFQYSLILGNAVIQNTVPPKSCYGCGSGYQPKWIATLFGIFYSSPIIVNVKANYSCNISSPNNVSYLSLMGYNNKLSNTKKSYEIKIFPNKTSDFVKISKEDFDIPYESIVEKYLNRGLTDEEVETLKNEIEIMEKSVNEITTVSIFDINGKEVYLTEMKSNELNVDATKYPKGIYIIKVKRGVEEVTDKLIVE